MSDDLDPGAVPHQQTARATSPTGTREGAGARQRIARVLRRVPGSVRSVAAGILTTAVGVAVARTLGLETPNFVLMLGALIGLSYGLLAVTLVLVFRITGVVNFAQPAIGAVGAALMPMLVSAAGLPYWVGFAIAVLAGFGLGAFIDFAVVRRFTDAPRVVVAAATIGAAVALTSATASLAQVSSNQGLLLPTPPGLFDFSVGVLYVTKDYTGLIIAAPVLVTALTWFMTRTRLGLAVRASAANPDAASLAGISPRAMTAMAWGIAGACATTLGIFFSIGGPAQPQGSTNNFTTTFANTLFTTSGILPALAAAAIARMTNYTRALVAGVCLGMLEQVLQWSDDYANQVQTVMFLVILVALLMLRSVGGRVEPVGTWSAVAISRPLPRDLARLWTVRALPVVAGLVAAALVTWRAMGSDTSAYTWTPVVAAMLIATSAGMITGLGGDLSLGQYAVAGVGAAAIFLVVGATGNEWLGLLAAAAAGGTVCAALAYPALRIGGLTLTILTASFAVMVPSLLQSDRLFGITGEPIGQPIIGTLELTTAKSYFLWTTVVVGLCLILCRNIWHSGFGRTAVAARDNRAAATAFSISTLRVQVQLFFVAGAVAGVAGALIIQATSTATSNAFPPDYGAIVVVAVILGGAGALYGGPLGTIWVLGLPLLTLTSNETNSVVGIFTAVLVVLLVFPRGLAHVLTAARDVIAVGLGRLHGVHATLAEVRGVGHPGASAPSTSRLPDRRDATAPGRGVPHTAETEPARPRAQRTGLAGLPMIELVEDPRTRPHAPEGRALSARGLSVSFGPIAAVRSVDLDLLQGEILGIIGPNGAGKTTTFEMLAGFVRPDSGEVRYYGQDITRRSPHVRAAGGLVRSFQDAALFPTMSVLDVLSLSLERQRRSGLTHGLLGMERSGRRRRAVARDLVDHFGLGRFAGRTVAELSTGTRRIVELACLTSLQPRVLLLDEPTAGIAQRETEAMATLIANMRTEFQMTIALVEHDIPFVTKLSDRMVAMAEGRVICSGTPAVVCSNQTVIDCYLGLDERAVRRSDLTSPPLDQINHAL